MLNIIFYGPEGSGKSTQAKLLAEKLGVTYIASGDLVRWGASDDQGMIGDMCRESLSKGYYVADTEMFVLWKNRLKQPDTENGWIIDGFPRNITQAEFLADKLDKYDKAVDLVFYLKVSEDESVKRLTARGRKSPDGSLHDSPDKIASRLKIYNEQEADVLSYYEQSGVLIEINGELAIEDIQTDIAARVQVKQSRT
jgi:adenylate kinase